MITAASAEAGAQAGAAFNRIASTYDVSFTNSLIGRAQRNAVWQVLGRIFSAPDNILELNCGTGEDALHLGSEGISVFACDASLEMIACADQRLTRRLPRPPVVFCHLPTERIDTLNPDQRFDGIFSNFSGLNCVRDLRAVSVALSGLVKDGAPLLLCFSTRVCLLEIAYYLACGQPAKALRRLKGHSQASLDAAPLTVYYPSLGQIRRAFAPHFRLLESTGIGVAIPPSYLEMWASRHPRFFKFLCRCERYLARVPVLRNIGDHILLHFEKVAR